MAFYSKNEYRLLSTYIISNIRKSLYRYFVFQKPRITGPGNLFSFLDPAS